MSFSLCTLQFLTLHCYPSPTEHLSHPLLLASSSQPLYNCLSFIHKIYSGIKIYSSICHYLTSVSKELFLSLSHQNFFPFCICTFYLDSPCTNCLFFFSMLGIVVHCGEEKLDFLILTLESYVVISQFIEYEYRLKYRLVTSGAAWCKIQENKRSAAFCMVCICTQGTSTANDLLQA